MSGQIQFDEILAGYSPISLAEIKNSEAGLMSRSDAKYLMDRERLYLLLVLLKEKGYRVFEISDKKIHDYETLYFDTSDFQFYMMHHNKKGTRLKVRIRRYVENNLIFLEIKEKSNKSVTAKKRIQLEYFPESLKELESLIEGAGFELDEDSLIPQLWTYFKRTTLVAPDFTERLTIDTDLHLKSGESEAECKNMVIVELKYDKSNEDHSVVLAMMRQLNIKPQGFSKYTIGTALINDDVKKNNFKLKLSELRSKFQIDNHKHEG